jgi:predicted amidohydrolase YtcJ
MRRFYRNFIWALTGEPQEMSVEDGRVVARNRQERDSGTPSGAEIVDLGGRYLLPAFIDAHCHILPTGLDLRKLHLGGCTSHDEVLAAVRDRHRTMGEGWLEAVHYDQTRYGEHLTRWQLDSVSADRPILLRHSNGHASVANSAALVAAGVGADEADPAGGSFRRTASGEIDGVMLESAHERVGHAVPLPSLEEMVQAILDAGEKMAELGIACATDMMTGRFGLLRELEAYRLAASRGCRIRTRLFIQWAEVFGRRAAHESEVRGLI